ncbi:PilT protein domain protein, partial [mine drainage metagenome]
MNVFDASALLAFLEAEQGAGPLEAALRAGGAGAAPNWSLANQKILAQASSWELARALLTSHPLEIEPVTLVDAEWAERRWVRGRGSRWPTACAWLAAAAARRSGGALG